MQLTFVLEAGVTAPLEGQIAIFAAIMDVLYRINVAALILTPIEGGVVVDLSGLDIFTAIAIQSEIKEAANSAYFQMVA